MNIIVAVADDFAIGAKNQLLARIPEDMKRFRATTTGKTIVVGRNTYLSFPVRPLPNRESLVITPDPTEFPEVKCFPTLSDFFQYAKTVENEILVCGGGMLYKSLLPYCEKAYITKIMHSFPDADTFFPDLDKDESWELVSEEPEIESNGYRIRFCLYENKCPLIAE